MATLQLTCLGAFQIVLDGAAPTTFLTDKARAMLVYLALEPQEQPRSRLTQIFWSGYSEESARNNLRQTLHLLRQYLGEEAAHPWLLVTRQTVQLNPAVTLAVDVTRFTRLLAAVASHVHADAATCPTCLADLRQAVDLYRGEFLTGLGAIDSAGFEEWRRLTQEHLHLRLLAALNQLALAAERAGDLEGALQAAHQQLTLEPWLETAHRQIMRLLVQRGQRAAAEAHYHRCRQVLAEELGVEPDAETTALYEQIRAGKLGREIGDTRYETRDTRYETRDTRHETRDTRQEGTGEVAASLVSPVSLSAVRDWAEMPAVDRFVERGAEVAQLTAWLTVAASAGVPVQLITLLGMGGIGKTTLAATVTRAVAPGFAVIIWRSLLNAPPLGELLRAWLQTLSRQRLTALPETLDDQLRLLLTYLQQERCLLVLDNVESLFVAEPPGPAGSPQPQSRAGVTRPGYEGYDHLFQRLATSEHQSCLLLTSREQPYALARVAPGPQGQPTSGRTRLLLLGGLDQQAGHLLLESAGLQATRTEAAQLIANYSGNPLALQIVAGAIVDFFGGDVAAFQQEAGGLFDGLRLVLDQQFARLSPLEREILVWLAIERAPVTVPALRANFVHPVATGPLLEALQALQNRALLEKRDVGFTLQNVIIEYTTDYLVEQVYQEILDFRFWILDYSNDGSPVTIQNPKSKIQNLFLNRFALLKAQAREEVRQSQVRLIMQPLANRLLAHLGKAQVEAQVMALVQGLQSAAPLAPGYAGGNLLNLLLHMGSDLRGRDFSRLALWQVFLAGAYAPALNLADADLKGAVFTQRFSPLHSFGFDAQGELLLAEISDGRLRLLRLHDGQLYQEVALPSLRIFSLVLSPDCTAVVMTLADQQLALLDLTSGRLFPPLVRHQHGIWRLCFSPDGRLIASGDGSGLVCLWDRQGGQLVQARQITAAAVSALAIAPDGETIASATVAGTVFLWSLADPSQLLRLQGHDEEVASLTFLGNGTLLASGSHDGTVGLWDVTTGELRQHLRGHTRPIRYSAAATTGALLVTGGGDHFLYVWDWQRGAPRHLLTDHAAAIGLLAMSVDGTRVATIDANMIISLWDVTHGRRLDFYPINQNTIMSLHFSPDGESLVAGGNDGAVYLWQMPGAQDARVTARLIAYQRCINAVAFHPDGTLIASGDEGHRICLWERSSGRLLQTLQGHTGPISMLAFSPDGRWLASSSGDGTIGLWSLPDGRQRRRLQGHTNMVSCCAFSPSRVDAQGRPQLRLASGSLDCTLAIWDPDSDTPLHHLREHTNAVGRCLFSHDGQRLISISYDATLRIWDVATGQPLAVWPHRGGSYITLAVHPDGELLAVSCSNHTIHLLELKSGRCLAELQGHSRIVITLAFHPNGQWLASAGIDETIRLWDLTGDALTTGQILCRHTLQTPAPYAGMKITGITGISAAQQAALRALGAVEE